MRCADARARAFWPTPLVALLLVACDAGGSNPFASFETRCGELPASRFEVVEVPITYREVYSQSVEALTVRSGNAPETHLTFGLTTVNFGHQTEIGIRSIDDPAGHRTCGTLDVRVRLSMQPVTVYLAEELDDSPCAREATLEHEQKHIAVFRAVLDEAARDLAADLAGAIGAGVQRAASQPDLERQVNSRINDYLSEFVHRRKEALDARQNDVDSPEEHARVRHACGE